MEKPGVGQNNFLGGHRELAMDPVKAQGVLRSVVKKERAAAKQWHKKWSIFSRMKEIQEEEAQKIGMSLEEYRAAVWSVNSQPEPRPYTDVMEPSPGPLPKTTSGMIGRRVSCPLERYGRLVTTGVNLPLHPPLPPGQVYDPYKQTCFFLGSIAEGDPISYKLPREAVEINDEMWSRPQQLSVTPLALYAEDNSDL